MIVTPPAFARRLGLETGEKNDAVTYGSKFRRG